MFLDIAFAEMSSVGETHSECSEHPLSGGMPSDVIECVKCLEKESALGVSMRNNHPWCKSCVNAYGSLTKRWRKNKQLRAWWSSKTKDEQVEWFVKRKKERDNVDDAFHSNEYEETSAQASQLSNQDVEAYIPYCEWKIKEQFRHPGMAFTEGDLVKRWNQALADPTNLTLERKGEILLYEFRGVEVFHKCGWPTGALGGALGCTGYCLRSPVEAPSMGGKQACGPACVAT